MKRYMADNFKGCLVGGAIGDALGYFVEFKNADEIFEIYGEAGLRDFSQTEGDAVISDDTQMTLFTANGLLYYHTVTAGDGGTPSDAVYAAYIDWLRSQNLEEVPDVPRICWLNNVKELNAVRLPGNTCMSALGSGRKGTVKNRINNSKGCGGIMRTAPVGLYEADPLVAARLGCDAAALTHGNPLGFIPAAAYSYIINRIIYTDEDLADVILDCVKMLAREFSEYEETLRVINLLTRAVELAAKGLENASEKGGDSDASSCTGISDARRQAEITESLGGGWVAEETLAIAVYCCLRYGYDLTDALAAAVNHSGDSDSTASLTGAIWGALNGLSTMPTKYMVSLELCDVITEMAQDLYNASSNAREVSESLEWEAKYLYHIYK